MSALKKYDDTEQMLLDSDYFFGNTNVKALLNNGDPGVTAISTKGTVANLADSIRNYSFLVVRVGRDSDIGVGGAGLNFIPTCIIGSGSNDTYVFGSMLNKDYKAVTISFPTNTSIKIEETNGGEIRQIYAIK